jgi:hypothetical protein
MDALAARDQLIASVKRDLYGPVTGDGSAWPGATVTVLDGPPDAIGIFMSPRDIVGMFADGDGNEVLPGSPLRRYGIGVLLPATMSSRQVEQLDAAQSEEALGDENTEELRPPSAAETLNHGEVGHADDDDAADEKPDRPTRPSSMAVSFLAARADARIHVRLRGGRYERVPVRVASNVAQFWRRQPVDLDVELATSGAGTRHHLEAGPLRIVLGASYRPHARGTIVTVFAVNETPSGSDLTAATEATLFQACLEVNAPAGVVADYPTADVLDREDLSLDLLYHRRPVRAVGHGCNAACSDGPDGTVIAGNHFPTEVVRTPTPDALDEHGRVLDVSMDDFGVWTAEAQAAVDAILDAYDKWIATRRDEIPALPTHLRDTAQRHLAECAQFLEDAREGWRRAHDDPRVQKVLCWTSRAMADQRRAYSARTRQLVLREHDVIGVEGTSPHHAPLSPARWRAFQITFLLASILPTIDPEHRGRDTVDIIWFATGAGKTEAYSAVAAFTMLWRRLAQVTSGTAPREGATVLMRYTLRLLTAQQLQRASSLICALEQIRRAHPDELGANRRFTIGAWLGRASTPNDREDATKALREWQRSSDRRAFLLTRCPWCGAAIGRRPGAGDQAVDGYKIQTLPDGRRRVMSYCPDATCPFNDGNQKAAGEKPQGLPVFEVDQDLYEQPPTFVVGTIDKFAMLAWRSEPASLFGLGHDRVDGPRFGPGPALLIQDELHLISGPLGSLDALYEPVIEHLCSAYGGVRPHIIAATATTRRYVEQTRALYGRSATRLIPPAGLDADDNFFSCTNPDAPGKIFVGICAPGFGKVQEAQVRLLAALSHAAGALDAASAHADPWWTNLCFFSSRRSLGLVQSLCQTHLRGHTWRLHRATGVHAGLPRQSTGTRTAQRAMTARLELTAQATSDVSEAMDRLSTPLGDSGCVDLCFATSMIEVGIDIDRLGLLTMFGQPKSASQYIQVAGRIGRNTTDAPGVVFVLLSPYNSRDRSHFERFSTFHQRLYASVEPMSITPFTPAAVERGLAGALTSSLRQGVGARNPQDAALALDAAAAPIVARVEPGTAEARNLDRRLQELRAWIDVTEHTTWGLLQPTRAPTGFLRILGDRAQLVDLQATTTWEVPTSMRSVDAESGARTIEREHAATAATSAAAPVGVNDGEDLF